MKRQSYSLPAIALHWIQAAVVIWLLWMGWTMIDLPKGAERTAAYSLHKSLGLLMLLVVIVRLAWRRRQPPPPMLVASGWEAKLAHATHLGLYGFLLLAPLAGYLASSFSSFALKFFGFEIPKTGWPDESVNAVFKQLHQLFAWGGAGLVLLHVAGTLKHFFKRDGTLQRILPW